MLYAVAIGDINTIAKCINEGVGINKKDDIGYTPLMLAARVGVEESVVFLLDNGADPNILDDSGKTAADIARDAGFKNLAEKIEKRKDSLDEDSVPESVKEIAIETFVKEKADEIKKKLESVVEGKGLDKKEVLNANNLNLVLFAEAGELSGWMDKETGEEISGYLEELNDSFEEAAKKLGRKIEKINIDKTAKYDLSPVFDTESKLLKKITREIYKSLVMFASSQLGIPKEDMSLKYEEYHERLVDMRKALLVSARDDGALSRKERSRMVDVAYIIGETLDSG